MQTNETKLEFAAFKGELCRRILELLGEEYSTELMKVRKNNGVLKEVLHVRQQGSECIPCFYTEELYRSYCMGENEAGLAEHLVNIVRGECEDVKEQVNLFLSKEWMTEHLFIRLIHYEKNEEDLKNAVYLKYLDLAGVVYVLTESSGDGVKSFQLPKHIWDTLELGTIEDFFPELVANTRRLFPEDMACISAEESKEFIPGQKSITVTIRWMDSMGPLHPGRLYVVTNHRRINGAAVLLYPELLKELGNRYGGGYYVIPSSIHEVLLLKDTGEEMADQLNAMVREVNETHVAPEERLSDHVYYYSVSEEELQIR